MLLVPEGGLEGAEAPGPPEGNLATLRVSADPWALNGPWGLVKRLQMMKSIMITCMCDTLIYLKLSYMDFLDCPAVTGTCTASYYSTTKSASPNELINLEILTINRPIRIYSFLGYWLAVFPG